MVSIAVMGHGVVGSGVVEVLENHKESIAKRAKEEININTSEKLQYAKTLMQKKAEK